MKYVTALPVLLIFALLDLAVLAMCLPLVGVVILAETRAGDEYPFSVHFAKSVWK